MMRSVTSTRRQTIAFVDAACSIIDSLLRSSATTQSQALPGSGGFVFESGRHQDLSADRGALTNAGILKRLRNCLSLSLRVPASMEPSLRVCLGCPKRSTGVDNPGEQGGRKAAVASFRSQSPFVFALANDARAHDHANDSDAYAANDPGSGCRVMKRARRSQASGPELRRTDIVADQSLKHARRR